MKIEEGSYYIQYFSEDGDEFASFSYYPKVWEDGYNVDDNIVCKSFLSFEKASWNEVPLTLKNAKKINSTLYNRWIQDIENTKISMKRLGQNANSTFVLEFKKVISCFALLLSAIQI